MKKITLGFIYNIRHSYPNPENPQAQKETDFDDPETIENMVGHFNNLGYKVISIEANAETYLKLYENRDKIDLVFNYSEGLRGPERLSQIPAISEILALKYTGSAPFTQAIVSDKSRLVNYLNNLGLPTPISQIFHSLNENLNENLAFPLLVKPVGMGSSAGITNKNVVRSMSQLKERVNLIVKTFDQPALVQTFLTGQEFSVALIGNPPKILPIIKVNHSSLPKGFEPIDSLEVKWIVEEMKGGNKHFICPAKIDFSLKHSIEKLCLSVWKVLEIKDFCRIDLRDNAKGNLFVLDVNSPAGLIPPEISMSSYFPLAARAAGIEYEELLQRIITTALKRYSGK